MEISGLGSKGRRIFFFEESFKGNPDFTIKCYFLKKELAIDKADKAESPSFSPD